MFLKIRSILSADLFGIRPSALSANAYDDYAYSLKGAITYGIFSNAGWTWRTRRTGTWSTRRTRRTRVSGWISGDSRGYTGRRSSANGSSTAIRTANVGHHICRRPRWDQTLSVPQHIHLAEQRRAILVLSDLRRA